MDDDPSQARQFDAARTTDDEMAAKRVDWEIALDVAAGDVELLIEVLDAFQIETPQQVIAIRQGLTGRDAVLLRRAAHTTKNALYSIGAQASGDLAFELEMLGKNAEFDKVPPLLDQLETHMRQVEQEVKQFVRDNR